MKLLDKQTIEDVAEKLNISKELLFAIDQVESAGSGFYKDEGPYKEELKVLFEGHIFHRLTQGKFDKIRPDLSYSKWTRKFYRKGQAEFGRFMEALKLDKEAAQLSTSWGQYQTMGFNFKKCGYNSVTEMILSYYEGEQLQFLGFLNFCENTFNKKYQMNLIELLQKYSKGENIEYLKGFVSSYNGDGQVDLYTTKILNNIKKQKHGN